MSASKNTYEWNLIQSKGQQYEPHPFDLLSLHPRSINPLLLEMNTNTPRTDVCLQKLIQEFYEWSRRDYPTEAEVREIMDRYYNLLNHNPNNKPS